MRVTVRSEGQGLGRRGVRPASGAVRPWPLQERGAGLARGPQEPPRRPCFPLGPAGVPAPAPTAPSRSRSLSQSLHLFLCVYNATLKTHSRKHVCTPPGTRRGEHASRPRGPSRSCGPSPGQPASSQTPLTRHAPKVATPRSNPLVAASHPPQDPPGTAARRRCPARGGPALPPAAWGRGAPWRVLRPALHRGISHSGFPENARPQTSRHSSPRNFKSTPLTATLKPTSSHSARSPTHPGFPLTRCPAMLRVGPPAP